MSGAPPSTATAAPTLTKLVSPLADAIRLTPVRPAIAAGIRAAFATIAPLALGFSVDRHELSWTALAGFLASIVDKGGAYAARARTFAGFALGAALLAPLAALVGDATAAMAPAIFLFATALGFLRIYGGTAGSVGAVLLVMVLVSLAQPAPLDHALARAGWICAGIGWAAALSLFMWPVRLYRPARAATARVLRVIGTYARGPEVRPDPQAQSLFDPHAWSRTQRALIRQAIEDARATLAATRRGRRGDSGRGVRLLALLETSDRLFAATVTLAEHLPHDQLEASIHIAYEARSRALLAEVAGLCERAAKAVEDERAAPVTAPTPPETIAAEAAHERLLERPLQLAHKAFELATSIEDERPLPETFALVDTREPEPLMGPLRAHWTLRSSLLRHALRAGVATTVAALLARVLELERGQWVTIAVAVILQPQLPATFLRATQRVLGTVLGALIAAAFTGLIETPWAMLPVMFFFAAVGVAVQPLSYALYSTFLTPTFVLLAETSSHDPSLVLTRIINTLIGGALALVAARFLWPISERDLFPTSARAALVAARDHLALVVASEDPTRRAAARREVGLALLNAETSLNRWLTEVRRRAVDLEAPLALIAHVRHLSAATLALGALSTPEQCARTSPFFDAVTRCLDDLVAAVDEQRVPHALPPLEALAGDPEIGARDAHEVALMRIADSLGALHAAGVRWLSQPQVDDRALADQANVRLTG